MPLCVCGYLPMSVSIHLSVSVCASLLSKSLPVCVSVCLHLGLCAGSPCCSYVCVSTCVCMCMYVLSCEILLACLASEEIGPCFSQHRGDIWRNGRRSLYCRLYLCHVLLFSSLCAALAVCGCFDISQVGLDSATFCLASQKVVLFFELGILKGFILWKPLSLLVPPSRSSPLSLLQPGVGY